MEITEAGFNDITVGTELFRTLDLNQEHFSSPTQMSKIREIAQFLNDHPDPLYVISMTKYNKSPNMDNIDYLAGYVRLKREEQDTHSKLERISKDLSYYGK